MYYANYLKFMERCRTDWLRAMGVDQVRLRAERSLQFVVVNCQRGFPAARACCMMKFSSPPNCSG